MAVNDALTNPNYPVYPANFVRRISHSTMQQFYAGTLGPGTKAWVTTYQQIWETATGLEAIGEWTGRFNMNTSADPDGSGGNLQYIQSESLFVNSDGILFLTSDKGAAVGKLGKMYYSTDGTGAAFLPVFCEGTATTFQFPYPGANPISGSACHFTQWSMWEIEEPWEAVGGLQVGDILMGTYHRYTIGTGRYANIYVMRFDSVGGVWEINADAVTMLPQAGGIGDPFAAWHADRGAVVRHIHHITMGRDGYLYFSCGDTKVGGDPEFIPGVTTGHYYRLCRMYPGAATWELLSDPADGNYGPTAMHLLDDGILLTGNDGSNSGVAGTMTIDRWVWPQGQYIADLTKAQVHPRFSSTAYSPAAWFSSPIWDIVRREGTDLLLASVQRNAANAASRGGLLVSTDGGLTFRPLVVSRTKADAYKGLYCDVDRVFHDRRRQIPATWQRAIINRQVDAAGDWSYFTYEF